MILEEFLNEEWVCFKTNILQKLWKTGTYVVRGEDTKVPFAGTMELNQLLGGLINSLV
jgi:hypothetical protein